MTERGRVFRFVRETADGVLDVARCEALEAGPVAPGDEFGKRGSRGDGSRAAANFETAASDRPVVNQSGKPKDISADRIRNLDGNRGRRQFTHIARILEMLDQFRRHQLHCKQEKKTLHAH